MFLNIQIDWIILKTYYQQFTLTTKKSLHIIFKSSIVIDITSEMVKSGRWTYGSLQEGGLLEHVWDILTGMQGCGLGLDVSA